MSVLNYQQFGCQQESRQQRDQGENVILIHGLFGSFENLNMVAKPLSEQFNITSVDTRNHGNSFHKSTMSYDEMAQDIIDLMDSLNIEKADFVGHSMGGKIAMRCAINFPDRVKKLIVADIAPVTYQARHTQILAGLNQLNLADITKRMDADKALKPYVPELGVRQFLLKNLNVSPEGASFKCNLTAITECYEEILAWDEGLAPCHHQTLFIKGANSDYILEQHRSAINKAFPNASAKMIQGAGHWLHAEKTIAFNKIVSDFLLSSN